MIMKRIFSVTLFIIILCLNCFASYASNENCFEKESLDSSINQEIVLDENEKDIKKVNIMDTIIGRKLLVEQQNGHRTKEYLTM